MNTIYTSKKIFLTLSLSIFFTLTYANNNSSINFLNSNSFKDIQKKAAAQNKPIFIDFYATWCAPCKKVEKEVFQNKEVATYMNQNFINYKVNIEKGNGPLISLVYEIELLPSVIIVRPSGDLILKKSTYMGSSSFLNWAKRGNSKFREIRHLADIKKLSMENAKVKKIDTPSENHIGNKDEFHSLAINEKQTTLD